MKTPLQMAGSSTGRITLTPSPGCVQRKNTPVGTSPLTLLTYNGRRPRMRLVGTELVDGVRVPVYRCESPAELYVRLHGPRARWDKRSPERTMRPEEP